MSVSDYNAMKTRLISRDVRPVWEASTGVPRCAMDDCPSYDGKRCKVLGCRPASICEPAVIAMADAIKDA